MKIGVFLCTCGDTLNNTLENSELETFAQTLPKVVHVETRTDYCQQQALQALSQTIKKKKLDRIVMAGCSPQLHGYHFENAAADAGLSTGQITYANIREHCAWVHLKEPQHATAKAKRLIRAAVNRATKQQPIPTKQFPVTQEVLVIGGGIAGIQSALDLANQGTKVHLVERTPTIGGVMAVLVKTFPSDDCAICIEGPKMADVSMHPNITLHCYSEVKEVTPVGKDFEVRILKKPTYVDWDKCTGCMSCTEKCPTRVTDEWTWGLGKRRAIYMPFSQSVPRKCTIDADYCKKILDDKCGVCAKVCPADAINYEMKGEEVNLRVGGVVLATGFEEFDPSVVPELNFTENPDVITQMQLARLLDTVGPMEGKLVCPSDGRKPKKMVMIQCVGSRDERYDLGCSRYCCMAALKHAVLTKVEQDADMDITIVARDIRAAGKGFEEYFVRACDEYGVKVVYRGDEVKVTQQNGKTKVVYTDEEGQKKSLPADLVILSCAMVPSKGTTELAQKLGLNLDEHGFFEAIDEKVALTRTAIPNIVLSGACHGPKDVPESVAQASAAAQEVASWLATAQTAKALDTASVNKDLCNACGLCVAACNYGAIEFTEDKKCVLVDEVQCIGCGECFAICPVGAIAPLNTNQEVIDAAVKGIVDNAIEGPSPIIIGFACKECSYRAIDEAGEKQLQYPANLHVVEVPCAGGISTPQILRTLEAGAEGVVLFACDTDVCHYGRGAGMATTRAKVVRNVLSQSGALPEQVRVVNMIGRDAKEFADAAKSAVDAILKGAKGG